MIHLDKVTVTYPAGASPVLDGVTLSIASGDWLAVAGGNGSGKTTLLATLAGLISPTSGRIQFDGERPPTVGLLLQEPDNQLVAASVRHELALSAPTTLDPAERTRRIDEAVQRFVLEKLLARNPHELSGGEKQRLALATVWLQDPDVVLLDEATAYLDRDMTGLCVTFIREMHESGKTIVWATPGGEPLEWAQRVIHLGDGRIQFDGDATALYRWAGENGVDVLRAGAVSPFRRAEVPVDDTARTVVQMKSVDFAYDRHPVFERVSAYARAGEVVGVRGPNASGKSTMLLLAGGALEPQSGTVRREGSVFYLPQSPERLFFAETVEEEMTFGLRRQGVSTSDARSRAHEALAESDLDPGLFLARSPFQLSLGEMRRLAFAIARALSPDLLLLDEPTSCLDTTGRATLARLLADCRQRGAAVLIATHDADFAAAACDRTIDAGNF